ncbi:MAG: hypothetical protein HZB16_11365 [Armatimonadetes bacterium]|nr:hypothetical protein [Armatimonadota bacterium]
MPDPRHLSNGWPIPSEGYADQPYVVRCDDGAWLCVMTTGRGEEGATGQHVVALRSLDHGRTWSEIVPIEPADGPEASYAVLLRTPFGRVYAFYNHNTDRVKEVKREDKGVYRRVDSLGHYVFRYSDDSGKTWSAQRYDVPVREFACDRENVYGGALRFFWNVGRPLPLADRGALMVLHKVGAMGDGFFARSEGAFLHSANILIERDPAKIAFDTLPDGEVGLRAPAGGGRVSEEQSVVQLSDGSLYCVYRTIAGWPTACYSRDGGHTWTAPAYMVREPGGPRLKHPRAANFVWKCANGKYLYWFHNHGGAFVGRMAGGPDTVGPRYPGSPYDDRNPAWLVAGEERDTPEGRVIVWSQPEIVLYDDDPFIRMSYPDLVEDGGETYLTETQKTIGRVHLLPRPLLEGLFGQSSHREVARSGLLAEHLAPAAAVTMPRLPELLTRDTARGDNGTRDLRAGFSLELSLALTSLDAGQTLFDSRDADGRGILLTTVDGGAARLTLTDGRQSAAWDSDRGVLRVGAPTHLVATVDGGPKIITFVVDGVLCDGGEQRQFGWGRYSPTLRTPHGAASARLAPTVTALRIYGRALRTSEAVGNQRAALAK